MVVITDETLQNREAALLNTAPSRIKWDDSYSFSQLTYIAWNIFTVSPGNCNYMHFTGDVAVAAVWVLVLGYFLKGHFWEFVVLRGWVAGKYGVVLWHEWLIDGMQKATGTWGHCCGQTNIMRLFWKSMLILSFVNFFWIKLIGKTTFPFLST